MTIETISSMNNNCSLVALKEVTNAPDEVIFRAVRKNGYKNNKGMYTHQIIAAAKELGLEVETQISGYQLVPMEGGIRMKKASLSNVLPAISDGAQDKAKDNRLPLRPDRL